MKPGNELSNTQCQSMISHVPAILIIKSLKSLSVSVSCLHADWFLFQYHKVQLKHHICYALPTEQFIYFIYRIFYGLINHLHTGYGRNDLFDLKNNNKNLLINK